MVCLEEDVRMFVDAWAIDVEYFKAADVTDGVVKEVEFESAHVRGVVDAENKEC